MIIIAVTLDLNNCITVKVIFGKYEVELVYDYLLMRGIMVLCFYRINFFYMR